MNARALIAAIRDGHPPGKDDLRDFAVGLADGRVSDAQAGAFAMAVLLKGLGAGGRTALTLAMRDSGRTLSWGTDRPVLDKHSTGGVGDCVSLVLAPALAACGACVPMISGRGLGHTGGTLDKLVSIPGLQVDLSEAQVRHVVDVAGCVIAAASHEIAPADRRLYAIRDVTATVESLDLITASILSKKLAAGLGGLVLDVKTGSGAFMKDISEARALAKSLVETANAAGCRTGALISDMSQPLAPAVGNAVEVDEAMKVLAGQATGRLASLTVALGGVVLADTGLCRDEAEGAERIAHAITSGAAAEHFGRMVAAMGGPVRFVDDWRRFLPEATVIRELKAERSGYLGRMDGELMGLAVIAMGGGRQVETDTVDPSVGLSDILELGAEVEVGQPILKVHATRSEHADRASEILRRAIVIEDTAPVLPPLVHDRIG